MKELIRNFDIAVNKFIDRTRHQTEVNSPSINGAGRFGDFPLPGTEEYDRLTELAQMDQQNMMEDVMYCFGFRL